MALKHYRELVAWQKAMDLTVAAYEGSKRFPADELYGLRSQLRRAAVSIPSNIAEGQGRGTPEEFKRFLRIANGSRQELETQILVAERLAYVAPEPFPPTHRDVRRGRSSHQWTPACPLNPPSLATNN